MNTNKKAVGNRLARIEEAIMYIANCLSDSSEDGVNYYIPIEVEKILTRKT